jgi:hypothetical protein
LRKKGGGSGPEVRTLYYLTRFSRDRPGLPEPDNLLSGFYLHRGKADMSDDLPVLLGHRRERLRAIPAQQVHDVRLGRLFEGLQMDLPYRGMISRPFRSSICHFSISFDPV